ncbi:hypothetical protein J6590_051843 [Homalodisca vitripennis]|nr:hypothetical protein J6590_051843 [Homalodisca vitripennis]
MEVNPKKCVVMHFSRSEVVFSNGYAINGNKLKTVDEFVLCWSTAVLFGHLIKPFTLKCSTECKSASSELWEQGLDISTWETPIHTVEELFDIQPLFFRQAYQDLNFLQKLVNGYIDCPDLLGAVTFTVPRETRSNCFPVVSFYYQTDLGYNALHLVYPVEIQRKICSHCLIRCTDVPNNVSMFSEFENGFLGAEIFFLIGGVVRSYNFFRDRHRGRPFSIVSSILIRYLRYTPALAGVMLFNYGLLVVCGQGPLWQRFTSHPVGACCQFWWTGLLHIANYVNPTAMCVHHSWYLASDFQLFLASPLFLIPLYFRPQLGLMMLAVTSIASVVALFFHSHSSAIYSEKMTGLSSHRGNNLISGNNITSHSRASPYLLGLALGYILFMVHNNRLHLRLSKTNIYWGWGVVVGLLAIVFMTSTIPTAYDPELTHWLYPVWNVFSRFVVASTAAWVILVCSLGHGEWLNQLLSWRGFQMLSKLVLGVYLVHFNVIIVQLFKMNQPFELNYVDVVYLGIGDLTLCLILAMVLYVSIELPCYRLAVLYFRSPSPHLPLLTNFNIGQSNSQARRPYVPTVPSASFNNLSKRRRRKSRNPTV